MKLKKYRNTLTNGNSIHKFEAEFARRFPQTRLYPDRIYQFGYEKKAPHTDPRQKFYVFKTNLGVDVKVVLWPDDRAPQIRVFGRDNFVDCTWKELANLISAQNIPQELLNFIHVYARIRKTDPRRIVMEGFFTDLDDSSLGNNVLRTMAVKKGIVDPNISASTAGSIAGWVWVQAKSDPDVAPIDAIFDFSYQEMSRYLGLTQNTGEQLLKGAWDELGIGFPSGPRLEYDPKAQVMNCMSRLYKKLTGLRIHVPGQNNHQIQTGHKFCKELLKR